MAKHGGWTNGHQRHSNGGGCFTLVAVVIVVAVLLTLYAAYVQ